MQLFNLKASVKNLDKLSTKIVYEDTMPRGKIYDRNYNVIVDNIGVNKLTYKKVSGINTKDEIDMAYKIVENIDIDLSKFNNVMLKEFWIANNQDKAKKKITDKEYDLYKRRKLKASELEKLKLKKNYF